MQSAPRGGVLGREVEAAGYRRELDASLSSRQGGVEAAADAAAEGIHS